MRLLHVSAAPKNSKNGQLPDIFSKNTEKSQVKRKNKSPKNRGFIEFSATKEPPHIPPLPNLENSSPTSPSHTNKLISITRTYSYTYFPPKNVSFPHNFFRQWPQLQPTPPMDAPTFRVKFHHFRVTSTANNPIGVSLLAGQCWRKTSTLSRGIGSISTP